ncbi:MAG: hypothetical protein SFW67_27665 [Myxococcaceae bacterium]|nr:hypothetical protein [Myxococcaceae bacterium]
MSTGSYRPKSKSSPKLSYVPLILKTKTPDGKWKVHGYLNVKPDLTGGVGTLVLPDGTKVDKVNVFPNDKKASKDTEAQDAA